MKKSLISAAFACAALAMPGLAMADDAMGGHDAMMAKPPAKMATMVCRPAAPGEKPTAMMMGDAKTAIVCKHMDPMMMMKKGAARTSRTRSRRIRSMPRGAHTSSRRS